MIDKQYCCYIVTAAELEQGTIPSYPVIAAIVLAILTVITLFITALAIIIVAGRKRKHVSKASVISLNYHS